MALLHISNRVNFIFRLYNTSKDKFMTLRPKSSRWVSSKTEENRPIIKKWARYWEDLIKDYLDVFKETSQHCKEHPLKSSFVFAFIGFSFTCIQTNPDEITYRDCVVKYSNDLLLVAQSVRNPKLDQFLTSIESCYNFGVLHRLNLGVFSIMWIDDLSKELGIYKSNCTYLKPEYSKFYQRIVDIGFFGKWWRLDSFVKDYDINSDEWASEVTK